MALSRRLTPSDIEQHRDCLAKWRSPDELLKYVDRVFQSLGRGVHGAAALFGQAGIEFLRDAQVAGTFGRLRDASAVRLGSNPPDFELRLSAGVEQWELTEADLPDRRRGDEYRAAAAQCRDAEGFVIEDDPRENWFAGAGQIPEALQRVSAKKATRSYAAGTKLLIYLNVETYGEQERETEASFAHSTKSVKDAFDGVWILWNGHPYEVWREGSSFRNEL